MVSRFFRRYQQAILISVTLVTIITFVSFYGRYDAEKGGGGPVAVIYGRNVPMPEASRLSRKTDLCQQLAQSEMQMFLPRSMQTMTELYQSLAINRQQAKENFMWNSLVLKHEAESLGITATEDEIFEATKAMPIFQTNGVYDSQRYAAIAQQLTTHRGFTTDDLADLIGDALRLKKIKVLLGATTAPSQGEIRETFTSLFQKTQASVVRFKFDDFLAAAQVTDDDVKKLYEERKASLKTDELRKVRYVAFILPTTDKPLQGKERGDALTELQKKADDFAADMVDKNAKFAEVAAKLGAKVEETPEFSSTQPPEALGASSDVAAAAFKLKEEQPNSDVIETNRGYYVLQLAGITPPRPLTFEEAKANLTDTLKHERAQEALNVKASEVRNKIETAMKGGKAFAAAAEAEGVKAEDIPPFSPREEPKTKVANGEEIMQTALELNEGQLSTVIPSSDGSLIVYVAKRLPIDETQLQAEKARLAEGLGDFQQTALFQEWLRLRRAAAQLKTSFHG